MELASHNIFQIQDPEKWWCRVSGLSSAHTVLRVDVIRRTDDPTMHFQEVIYLEFRKVAYYSGWMTWRGANFRLASNDEKASLLRDLEPVEHNSLVLFIVDAEENKQVYILANAARLVDNNNNAIIEVP